MRFRDTRHVRTRFDERVAMPDGTELSVDLYLPAEPGRYPALLTRTPYDNNRLPRPEGAVTFTATRAPSDTYRLFASHGYVVAAADVRGRGDSDGGPFRPFVHEAEDGAATVAWLAGLTDCDGRVGMFGSGYAAFCAWAVASCSPGALAAIVSTGTLSPPWEGLPGRGGAVRLDWLLWQHLTAGRIPQDPDLPPWPTVLRTLPSRSMAAATGAPGDLAWEEWLDHQDPEDPYWDPLRVAERLTGVDTPPALHLTGWWDSELSGGMAVWGATGGPRDRLVVGPWDHRGVRRPVVEPGGIWLGPRTMVDVDELTLDWFDRHLRGAPDGSSRASVFLGGRNEWADLPAWPPATTERTLYLRSRGVANTFVGNGRLDDAPAEGVEPADQFDFNPQLPVPWQPGAPGFTRTTLRSLTLDQSFLESRDDVLVYSTAPLAGPLLITGRPRVVLHASSSAEDTDWVVLLSDATSDERSIHLSHGILRTGRVTPGELFRYEIELGDVGWELQPGHRLRLCVTSSLFPLYDRNLGGAQLVAHDGLHPSQLILPIPTKDLPT